MNRKLGLLIFTLILSLTVLTACGSSSSEGSVENPMQYIALEDLKTDLDNAANEYVVLDVRKIADYDSSHIKGSHSADLDAAKNGDNESGIANLKAAINEAVGSETGDPDSKYVLVCYSGKSYAQKGTDLLIEMGVPASNVYTLEGGMTAWTEAGDEYTGLVE